MINCPDSRGKGIVFFLLVIYSGLVYSCNFEADPISTDYMKKINTVVEHMLPQYQVERPRIISEETEDQNCFHLLTLFLSNYTLANIRPRGSALGKMIISLQNEIHFIGECSFKIPTTCPNEKVNIDTVLQNLNASLRALKPNIEKNFTHCLRVKCATVEHISTMRSTIATKMHNKSHQDSIADVLSEEHTTPTVNQNDSLSDQIGGDPVKPSNGTRIHYLVIIPMCGICIFVFTVIL